MIKFSFSEKATKICAICLMVLTFTKYINVKTIRRMVQIFVAFSEKLNFTVYAAKSRSKSRQKMKMASRDS